MGLSCACYDFDKGDYERWWESASNRRPPSGTRCCECGAPLPTDEKAICFAEWEVFNPAIPEPPSADNEQECGFPPYPQFRWRSSYTPEEREEIRIATAEWEQEYGPAIEFYRQQREDWESDNGWDDEYQRCERITEYRFRCDRCQGLAEAIEELGYCTLGPDEVIDAHIEYAEEHSGVKLKWANDRGTFNPRRWNRADYVEDAANRFWSRIRFYILYGWKLTLRYKIIWPIEKRFKRWRGEKWPQPAKMKIFGSRMY